MGKHTFYTCVEGKQAILSDYETYLQTFEIDIERVFVETTFGRTHVLVGGPRDGKPLFIFQGGNCINPMTLSWFKPLFDRYRVYAPDTIGHPGFSEEIRISARDDSFPRWISELMNHFQIEKAAFVGPSYGAGITLRMAAFMPDKIACAVLVSPSGLKLGSKIDMIRKILIPLMIFKLSGSKNQMNKIAHIMSDGSMKEIDRDIIASIFKFTKLEQDMPKLTEKKELLNYSAPTMVIAGKKDVFFPERQIRKTASEVIPNLTTYLAYDMGHFPSDDHLERINEDILDFLSVNYKP